VTCMASRDLEVSCAALVDRWAGWPTWSSGKLGVSQ